MVNIGSDGGGVDVVYQFTGALGARDLQLEILLLDGRERARLNAFLFAADRRDFAAAHALLRRVLSRHGGLLPQSWAFETSVFGKPAIAEGQTEDPPLTFSLSHTRGLVACAVGRAADIGVDVESLDRMAGDPGEIATRYFSPLEVQNLQMQPPSERRGRFIDVWTLKEAYLKAIGLGLSHPLNSFAFEFAADGALRLRREEQEGEAEWQCAICSLGESRNYRLAVAVRRRDGLRPRIVLSEASHAAAAPATLLWATRRDSFFNVP